MRYLQGTKDYKLTYRHTDQLKVIGYLDSDFARCVDTRKSTSGYIFLISGGAISWRSTKKNLLLRLPWRQNLLHAMKQQHRHYG